MNKCDCYHIRKERHYFSDYEKGFRKALYGTEDQFEIREIPECWGTREQDRCSCGGDRSKCSFYEHIREEAQKQAEKETLQSKLENIELELFKIKENIDGLDNASSHCAYSLRVIKEYVDEIENKLGSNHNEK